jgi:S-adenosylmethionine hydrolase
MKGVILSIAPRARLIDLTHNIAPQAILEASARLEAALPYFPPGTIHLVVVDPGVGSARRACVVETAGARYVAPDNGVLTLPLRRDLPLRSVFLSEMAQPYCRHPVSATFHGRDVFAPIAAHLANGLPLHTLGPVVEASSPDSSPLVTLDVPVPSAESDASGHPALRLHILYADRFGNLVTDLTPAEWTAWLRQNGLDMAQAPDSYVIVEAGGRVWRSIARTFADVPPGSPLAYWGSGGRLEIAIRDGSAAQSLSLTTGDTILLKLSDYIPA